MRRTTAALLVVLGVICGQRAVVVAQTGVATALNVERSGEAIPLIFFNRPITVLKARVMGRGPAERAAAAERVLQEVVTAGITGPVESHRFDNGVLINVGSRGIVAVMSLDVDELSGETLDGVAAQTVDRLQRALREAAEARAPAVIMRGAVLAAVALLGALVLLWGVARVHRLIAGKLIALAERHVTKAGIAGETLRASRVLDIERGFLTAAATVADLFVIYVAVTFVLRRFPYTRPWGESMRGFMLGTLQTLALGAVNALPGLFTVAVILLAARLLVRLLTFWFNAIDRGQVRTRWIYPETAQPTRRLMSALVWLFAIVVAYPYMPGSQTDAFKGVSVFLGLMITFGSSGFVNQVMSGFMITYSRALRVGDFVRIGETEGVVSHLGVLSIKVKTLRREEVTIPNAVVVSLTTTDLTRFGETEGVFTPTSVTIGYDTPWRQVEALLLEAAERTPGLRAEPKPIVLQAGLEDFYVKYTLLVSLERQEHRPLTMGALHANIQDLFNEHGVQIMSPHYVLDPAAPKIVPRQHWFDQPARPETHEPADRTDPLSIR